MPRRKYLQAAVPVSVYTSLGTGPGKCYRESLNSPDIIFLVTICYLPIGNIRQLADSGLFYSRYGIVRAADERWLVASIPTVSVVRMAWQFLCLGHGDKMGKTA